MLGFFYGDIVGLDGPRVHLGFVWTSPAGGV